MTHTYESPIFPGRFTTLKRELAVPGELKISDLSQLTFTQPRVALGNRELPMEILA